MEISHLRVNHLTNPIGYKMEKVSLSWQVEKAKGIKTVQVQIQISKDAFFVSLLFDSGKIEHVNSLDYNPAIKLEDGTRYYWRVFIWDDQGDHAVSEPAYFETAQPMKIGQWMKAPFEKEIHPIFYKRFQCDYEISKARLIITGLGVYEAQINGKPVSREVLAPFYNDYNLWIQYQTYDVTDLLHQGNNAIGVMLGNGWYKGRFGFIDKLDCLYGDTMQMICELHITKKDGTKVILPSDATWKCCESPVIESSIYDGEVYDSRKENVHWSETECDDAAFSYAEITEGFSKQLTPRLSLPLEIQERFHPVELIHTPAGEEVLDFGQNMTGWVEFECREEKDTEVKFQFGEILQKGNFYNENLRTAKETYVYISNGKPGHVRPHFTFYGFRYMKVTGIKNICLNDFTACVIHSSMEVTGKVITSNQKINQLFHNAFWGQKGNFVDVPTDCPQRDERMGWTGDAQVFCATASYNMYTPAFYKKFLYDMRLEQRRIKGSVPHVVPDILGQIDYIMARKKKASDNIAVSSAHGSCAWADAATIIPWTVYCQYGDRTLLMEQYENMKLWVDYIKEIDETKCGGKRLWTDGFHFADWLALDNFHQGSSFGGTDTYYVASAFYYYSATLLAKAARVLGKKEDAVSYETLSDEIKTAIRKEYFTETGRIAVDTQTAMVLALYFDFVPETAKERLIQDLKKKLEEENNHLTTGFVGTPYLCPVLSKNGLADKAYTLLLNEDYPSWLYEVNMGATTIWERWNSVLPDGSISDTGMNSLNHYAYGSIVEWMYRYMCGLSPKEDAPGFKEFILCPYPDARLKSAGMTFHSPFGEIESRWEYKEEGICYHVTVPYDTTAEFILTHNAKEVYVNDHENKELLQKKSIILTKGNYTILVRE